jgi:hypothetical protein
VVAAVLLEVALVARVADPLDDLGPAGAAKLLELGLQLVELRLGQPDDIAVGRLGHGVSPVASVSIRAS